MRYTDYQYLESEKQRLLQKYGCKTISEVKEKLEQILREQSLKLKNLKEESFGSPKG